jgi:ParB-like chromosome segregation protein Spo0J
MTTCRSETIDLDKIHVPGKRLRKFRPEMVAELIASLSYGGSIPPVILRPIADGYRLVRGEHQLAAVRRLGRITIDAIIVDGMDDDSARAVEIEEGLLDAWLSPAQRRARER